MGLHNTAHYLKSKGRGTDTELVHMSKNEIKGLQQIAMAHGGSLSINPDTGLVEAGFLEQVLPVVAAAGLTYLTAGAAAPALATALGGAAGATAGTTLAGGILAGAGAGALISGGTAAIQGKDVGKAALYGGLGGAIAGGVGAYGGDAGVVGAEATQKAAMESGTAALDPSLASYGQTPMTPQDLSQGVSQGTITPQAGNQYGQAYNNVYNAPPPPPAPTFYSGLEPNGIGRAGIQALPAIGLMEDKPMNPAPGEQYDPNNPMRWKLSNNFQGSTPVRPNPYYSANYSGYAAGGPIEQMSMQNQNQFYPQGQQEHTQFATPTQMPTSAEVVNSGYEPATAPYSGAPVARFANRGKVDLSDLEKMYAAKGALSLGDPMIVRDSDPNTRGLSALGASEYNLKRLGKRAGVDVAPGIKSGIKDLGGDFSDVGASGGTASLGGYSDGGRMLKGPGDGMSDSIPANIGGKQPARLADGEFVVPADVVSHLGNGSTDAGAKKLYAMMDKIRKARTGKKKQAPAVKADKFMPA
jgi:hypothetical protein